MKKRKKDKILDMTRHQILDELSFKGQDWSTIKRMDNYELIVLWNKVSNTDYDTFTDFEPANRTGAF